MIIPKSLEEDEYTPAQRRSIDRGIAASERDYAEGRSFGPFATHEAFIFSLHSEAAKLRKKKNKRCNSCSELTSPLTPCKEIR